ncbi:MAG: hypothetical protein ACFCUJ_02145 [Thiotrichales bacterium]
MPKKPSNHRLRRRIAAETARIIADEGVGDYQHAKQKACARLGLTQVRDLPNNLEIEEALIERQRLFATGVHTLFLRTLRERALEVMAKLERHDPHLVGSVLKGTANRYAPIQLHLFSDDVESIAIELINRGIHYRAIDRRQTRQNPVGIPGFAFEWRGTTVEVLVFPVDGLRAAPPSPIDGRPMQRANAATVARLLIEPTDLPEKV